ncbi:hypothetical protein HMPREF1352_00551 [Enterococcus faecium 511]|nr:hypothetical protein HMPREF1371_02912 [Enterococcus faecium P1137]EJY25529.1 hypothetical protein HMPREF1356_00135 [Enterococcus faecium C1904]EJY38931.1 hypothetical protein HMPREF1352_00551 [Enterococcus faecium 511]EJY40799.1 hypothetical protein HMPREF1349_02885 [Enterococcus faecium 506]EPI25838.1 hypothetical protein D352_00249 [Enterococcus faecium LA4B-2]
MLHKTGCTKIWYSLFFDQLVFPSDRTESNPMTFILFFIY